MDVLRCAADESDHSRQILCKWWFVRNPETAIKLSSAPEIRQEIPYDGLDLAKLNYVVVVGGLLRDANKIYPQAYQFLNTAHKAGVSVVAICAGFLHLARAGLLAGKRCAVTGRMNAVWNWSIPMSFRYWVRPMSRTAK